MQKIWFSLEKTSKKHFIILIFLVFLSTILEAVSISLLLPIIVALSDNNFNELYPKFNLILEYLKNLFSTNIINTALLSFAFTIIIKNFYQLYVAYKENHFLWNVQEKTSQRLFEKFLFDDLSFHLQSRSSDLVTKIRNETKHFSEGVISCVSLISDLLLVFSICIILFLVSFKVTLLSIFFAFLFSYLFLKVFKNYTKRTAKSREELDFKKTNIVQESIQGIRELIISNIIAQMLDIYKKTSDKFAKYLINFKTIEKLPKLYFEFVVLLGVTVAIFIFSGTANEITIKTIIPTIGIYAASAFRILPALNRIISSISRVRFVTPAIVSVYNDLNKKIKQNEEPKSIKINKIVIKNLSFSYKNPAKKIFNKLNFQINKGDKILICGESGEGKSTFLDLLAGLQEADSGEIVVNDEFKVEKSFNLTKSLGYVSQKVFLFNKSLKYNISLSDEKIDEKKFMDAIKISSLDNLMSTYKNNFETILGDNGAILSGGQRQRVMLARAIYNSGDFLIMDEPTSSLDSKTANTILNNLVNKENLTIIMVSHNAEYKKFFSKTIEIKKKDIVESQIN